MSANTQAGRFQSLALMLRGRAGLTQRQLAEAVGLSERAVQVWESGLGHPSPASLERLIAQYLAAGAFSPGREADEAEELWHAALAEAPRLKKPWDAEWFADLLDRTTRISQQPRRRALPKADWADAPAVTAFHGREAELDLLGRWLLFDNCRVVGLSGMGGMGKTALAAKIAQEVAPHQDAVFWRSLRNGLQSTDWLSDAILFLSGHRWLPREREDARRLQLLELLRERRCLLVLDNLETVLEPGLPDIAFRSEHAGYGLLLQMLGETAHQSCAIVTTREQPSEIARLAGPHLPVRVLRLSGLDGTATEAMLADKGLSGNAESWHELMHQCDGNPLALQVLGETIATLFGGDIASFLRSGRSSFGDIRRLLESQLARLSKTERAVLYWLALEREPVDFETLVADLGPLTPHHDVLNALRALDRRSLVETAGRGSTFTLQPVVLEHVTDEIVQTVSVEILRAQPALLVDFPLIKVQVNGYARGLQERLVAQPILQRLALARSPAAVELLLIKLLDRWRGAPRAKQGFGPGNVINLLRLVRTSLRDLDLSRLLIRHTDLSCVEAHDVSLAFSHLDHVSLAQQLGPAVACQLSADGRHLAIGTLRGEVRVWRIADGNPMLLAQQAGGPTRSLSISGDGQLVASCGEGAVFLWDVRGSDQPRVLRSEASGLWCVALSADGRVIAAGAGDGTAQVWDAETGECKRTFRYHTGAVRNIALSHDGQRMATRGDEGQVAIWDLSDDARPISTLRHSGLECGLALSADGAIVAIGERDGVVQMWDACGRKLLGVYHGHRGPIRSVALTADGGLLASGGIDGSVRLWETRTAVCRGVLMGHTSGVIMVGMSGDGRLASSIAHDGSVHVWQTHGGRRLMTSRGNLPGVFEVTLSTDARLAIGGFGDGAVRVWDIATRHCVAELRGHVAAASSTAASSDGTLVVSGSLDHTVRLWSLSAGKCRTVLAGHELGVTSVALSPDQRMIASASFDGTFRLWDVATGTCLKVRKCHTGGIGSIRFADHGRVLLTCDLFGAARVWDVDSGDCLGMLGADSTEVAAVAVSESGQLVACAEASGAIRIWDARSRTCVQCLRDESIGIRGIAVSHAGCVLAAGGIDGALRVWDLKSGVLRSTMWGHSAQIWGVDLTPNGRVAASAGLDGTIRLWDLADGLEACVLRPDRQYERMDITGLSGVTEIQRKALIALGAVAPGADEGFSPVLNHSVSTP